MSFGASAQGGGQAPPRLPAMKQAGSQDSGGTRQLSAEQRAELRRQLTQFSRRPGKGS